MRLSQAIKEEIITNGVHASKTHAKLIKVRAKRQKIAKEIVEYFAGDADAVAAIVAKEAELIKAFTDSIPDALREARPQVRRGYNFSLYSAAPSGSTSFAAAINFDGTDQRFGRSEGLCAPVERQKPVVTPNTIVLDQDSPLLARCLKLKDEYHELYQELVGLHKKIEAMVAPFNTDKKLIASWPEAIDLLPAQEVKEAPKLLPMEMVSTLNKELGLPKENKAVA